MTLYYWAAGIIAVTWYLWSTLRGLYKYPSAPGSSWAAFTSLWYTWKVWQGKFEVWNIQQHATHGKVVRITPNSYSIDDPSAVKILYSVKEPLPKSSWYSAAGDPRAPNLFSSRDVKHHASMRRMVAGLYSMTAIKSYEPYVDSNVRILLRQFDNFAEMGQVFNLQHWMQCYAFDTIGEMTYGHRVGFLESGGRDISGIMAGLERLNSFNITLGTNYWTLPLLLLRLGTPIRKLLIFVNTLTTAREHASDQKRENSEVAEDFFTKLEAVKKKNPEGYVKYGVDAALGTNVVAGSDTTSVTLTGIMFHLIKKQEVFKKLREELLSAISEGRMSDPITFDEAQNLPYLRSVLKEGMRMHAATGLPMWRVIPKPGLIVAGTFFPEGAIVGINSWVAHHNTTVFGADASQFRPERWDPANTSEEQLTMMERYFLTFGSGTRTCIGKHISTLEINKLVPELVRRYDFELLSTTLRYNNHWFVKPKDVPVRIRLS